MSRIEIELLAQQIVDQGTAEDTLVVVFIRTPDRRFVSLANANQTVVEELARRVLKGPKSVAYEPTGGTKN